MELQGIEPILQVLRSIGLGEQAQMLNAAAVSHFSWELFIGAMLDEYTPQLSVSPANVLPGHLDADLLVCTAISQGSILSTSSYSRVTVDGVAPPETLIPVAWHIPATASQSSGAAWWSPKYRISSMQVTQRRRRRNTRSSGLAEALSSPTVGKAAAMSSAAAGFLGSSSLLNSGLTQLLVDKLNLQGMAVCGGSLSADHPRDCDYPSVRLIDGGFADDSGIATVVAKLQDELGTAATLKVVCL